MCKVQLEGRRKFARNFGLLISKYTAAATSEPELCIERKAEVNLTCILENVFIVHGIKM